MKTTSPRSDEEIADEARAKRHREFLLRAVDELSSSLDYEKTLATVARLAVPSLAAWCAVDLAEGDRVRRVAIAHVDPKRLALVEEYTRRYPPDPDAPSGVHQILRTGKPEFLSEIPRELIEAVARDDEQRRFIDELQLRSYIGVPLSVRGETIGVLTFAMAESARRHTDRDFELACALADRAALAIDHARLFREVERARAAAAAHSDSVDALFQLMVQGVKDYAIFMLDPGGIVATWNIGAELINGYRPDEIIGQHFSRFYTQEAIDAGHCEEELAIAKRDGRFEEEGWRLRKDGSRFWASVVITAIRDSRGQLKGFAKVTRDLTERRRNQEALMDEVRRRAAAESESQFAQNFVGILGHDLRNPLNAILMATSLLKKKAAGAETKALDRISTSATRMSNMVAQLLDLTRSRLGGGITVERRTIDLAGIISEIVDELRLAYAGREIQWTRWREERGDWDPDRLGQVVSNLVGNALEHADPSKPIVIDLSPLGSASVVLTVHSFGTPISPELLPVIFEPYRRHAANTERAKGLGLGLFITQQIVLAHGGRIEVRSTAEGGTLFTVTLPRTSSTKVTFSAPTCYPERR